MPLTATEQARLNIYKISTWTVTHGPADRLTISVLAGLADASGTVAQWIAVGNIVIEGTALTTAMGAVATKTRTYLDAGQPAARAAYLAIKETLYEAVQAAGIVPTGTLT